VAERYRLERLLDICPKPLYPYYGYGYYGYPAYYGYPHILRTPTAMLIPPMATTDRAIGMRAGTPTRAIVGKA
jgi:hypothetical protein